MAITIENEAVERFIADQIKSGQFRDEQTALTSLLQRGIDVIRRHEHLEIDEELQTTFDQADAEMETGKFRDAHQMVAEAKARLRAGVPAK